jgi:hypothetical protein
VARPCRRFGAPLLPEAMAAQGHGDDAAELARLLVGTGPTSTLIGRSMIASPAADARSAVIPAMDRLDGRYYLLALCADDYVAGFPKQMELSLPQ